MDERLRFIREHRRQAVSMSDLCRAFGISRRTGYKWLARFDELGEPGLSDRSRAPATHPNATARDLEDVIIELRQSHMSWGPRKLRAWFQEHIPNRVWPSASTFGEIVQRHGLVMPARVRRRSPPFSQPLAHANAPNEVWCADFKGWFRTKDGARCDPLTMTDAYSRYLLCARGVERTDGDHVKPIFERAFSEFGLPVAIRTDNGSPFASIGLGGLSRLSVWWVRLGIRHERIAPGKPQQNGRHERMHRTMKAETANPPAADLRAQQRVFDRFRSDFNNERPHEALGMKTPSRLYEPSPRPLPRKLPEVEYPKTYELRHVRSNGEIKLGGEHLFVSEALTGEVVGLDRLDDRYWRLHFGPVPLGCVDAVNGRWATKAELQTAGLLPMCPV
jgi:transposase InsO family protein